MLCLNMEMKSYLTKYLHALHTIQVLCVTADDLCFPACVVPIALDTFPALFFVHSFCLFVCLRDSSPKKRENKILSLITHPHVVPYL